MIGRILPREEKFFEYFKQSAALILEGAQLFQEMLSDLSKAESYAQKVSAVEDRADKVAHQIIELLHKTFITPLDREEIHRLISKMDDIIDFIEDAASRIYLYRIMAVSPEAHMMANLCVKACEFVLAIMNKMDDFKESEDILKTCVEINRLENEADRLLRISLAKLFDHEPDMRQLLKLKEIYELLEIVTDRCEDVSNIVEGIVLEHS